MTTSVTGFTKARVDTLVNTNVTGASLDVDNVLKLTRASYPVTVGNVKGDTGDIGPTGPVSSYDLTTAIGSMSSTVNAKISDDLQEPKIAHVGIATASLGTSFGGIGGTAGHVSDSTVVDWDSGGPTFYIKKKGVYYFRAHIGLECSGPTGDAAYVHAQMIRVSDAICEHIIDGESYFNSMDMYALIQKTDDTSEYVYLQMMRSNLTGASIRGMSYMHMMQIGELT